MVKRIAYPADILEQQFSLKLQGKKINIIRFQDNLRVFVSKLQNLWRKVNLGNIAMFERNYSVVNEFKDEKKKWQFERRNYWASQIPSKWSAGLLPWADKWRSYTGTKSVLYFHNVASIPDEGQRRILISWKFSDSIMVGYVLVITKYHHVCMSSFTPIFIYISLPQKDFQCLFISKTKITIRSNTEKDGVCINENSTANCEAC